MKKTVDVIAAIILGFAANSVYSNQQVQNEPVNNYATRNIETELKAEMDRVNLILNDAEQKYIKSNIPKPKPPNPVECSCGGAKEIVHGDGHKTPCPCGANCVCTPKATPQ
jgi:hypothetical protein